MVKDIKEMSLHEKILHMQMEMPAMRKDNDGYNYKYFDINQMIEVMKPLLKKYGLLVVQPLTHIEGKPAIQTSVISGEEQATWITPLPTNKTVKGQEQYTDPQKMGSAITYYRRYALQSLFMLQAEDNDGRV